MQYLFSKYLPVRNYYNTSKNHKLTFETLEVQDDHDKKRTKKW